MMARLQGKEYCSPEHRDAYLQAQGQMALSRLMTAETQSRTSPPVTSTNLKAVKANEERIKQKGRKFQTSEFLVEPAYFQPDPPSKIPPDMGMRVARVEPQGVHVAPALPPAPEIPGVRYRIRLAQKVPVHMGAAAPAAPAPVRPEPPEPDNGIPTVFVAPRLDAWIDSVLAAPTPVEPQIPTPCETLLALELHACPVLPAVHRPAARSLRPEVARRLPVLEAMVSGGLDVSCSGLVPHDSALQSSSGSISGHSDSPVPAEVSLEPSRPRCDIGVVRADHRVAAVAQLGADFVPPEAGVRRIAMPSRRRMRYAPRRLWAHPVPLDGELERGSAPGRDLLPPLGESSLQSSALVRLDPPAPIGERREILPGPVSAAEVSPPPGAPRGRFEVIGDWLGGLRQSGLVPLTGIACRGAGATRSADAAPADPLDWDIARPALALAPATGGRASRRRPALRSHLSLAPLSAPDAALPAPECRQASALALAAPPPPEIHRPIAAFRAPTVHDLPSGADQLALELHMLDEVRLRRPVPGAPTVFRVEFPARVPAEGFRPEGPVPGICRRVFPLNLLETMIAADAARKPAGIWTAETIPVAPRKIASSVRIVIRKNELPPPMPAWRAALLRMWMKWALMPPFLRWAPAGALSALLAGFAIFPSGVQEPPVAAVADLNAAGDVRSFDTEGNKQPLAAKPARRTAPRRAAAPAPTAPLMERPVPPASQVSVFTSFQDRLSSRAAIALTDDFRNGLSSWEGSGNWASSWSYDEAGFVRPGAMALYVPTLGLTEYRTEFVAQIARRSISWVVRARDLRNYQVIKLVESAGSAGPELTLVRYPVVGGRAGRSSSVAVALDVGVNDLYRVSTEVKGSDFVVRVQGKVADSWSEERLSRGGVGFFTERGEVTRLRWVGVWHQYDMIGRLCALLAPPVLAGGDRGAR